MAGREQALAAASRALRGYNEALADECLTTAQKVWTEEHSHAPDLFHHGNTTGGRLEDEELKAAVELLLCTKDQKYAQRINEMWPYIKEQFGAQAGLIARAIPFLDRGFANNFRAQVGAYKKEIDKQALENPFGVPINTGGWAGSGQVIRFAQTNYVLHKMYPDLITAEDVFKGLNYIYGCHPGSNISLVSGVGTQSKKSSVWNEPGRLFFYRRRSGAWSADTGAGLSGKQRRLAFSMG